MTDTFAPIRFDAPLVNPAANGLLAATLWQPQDGPLRWLDSGVEIVPFNYGGEDSFGVWAAAWNAAEADLEPGVDVKAAADRPAGLEPFLAVTSWAADSCDLTRDSRAEVRTRAEQTHRLQEPGAVEAEFAERILSDAGTAVAAGSVVAAVSALEGLLAKTNTAGFIHAGAGFAAYAAQAQLIVRSGTALKTPLGHTWVFGGGYVDALSNTLVATSPVFGWRGEVMVRDAAKLEHNRFYAIAERSLVVGVEHVIGAAEIVVPEAP